MPTENRLEALVEDLRASLVMRRADGYWFDYSDPVVDSRSLFTDEPNPERPTPYLWWDGATGALDIGNELASRRTRQLETFWVEVSVKGDDRISAGKLLRRVRQDVHKAVLTDRTRGSTRVNTFDSGTVDVAYAAEGPVSSVFGIMRMKILVRWDHVTGDMTTQ